MYRETVLMIVSDKKQGLKALRFCARQDHTTPMRELIKLMPGKCAITAPTLWSMLVCITLSLDVAKWVLNECAQVESRSSPQSSVASQGQDFPDGSSVENDGG